MGKWSDNSSSSTAVRRRPLFFPGPAGRAPANRTEALPVTGRPPPAGGESTQDDPHPVRISSSVNRHRASRTGEATASVRHLVALNHASWRSRPRWHDEARSSCHLNKRRRQLKLQARPSSPSSAQWCRLTSSTRSESQSTSSGSLRGAWAVASTSPPTSLATGTGTPLSKPSHGSSQANHSMRSFSRTVNANAWWIDGSSSGICCWPSWATSIGTPKPASPRFGKGSALTSLKSAGRRHRSSLLRYPSSTAGCTQHHRLGWPSCQTGLRSAGGNRFLRN